MYIGELANKTGTTRKAIYLYEALGFQLKELAAALNNNQEASAGLSEVIAQLQHKREALQAKISAAQAQLDLLNQLENQLRSNPDALQCNTALDLPPRGKL